MSEDAMQAITVLIGAMHSIYWQTSKSTTEWEGQSHVDDVAQYPPIFDSSSDNSFFSLDDETRCGYSEMYASSE